MTTSPSLWFSVNDLIKRVEKTIKQPAEDGIKYYQIMSQLFFFQ